MSNPVTFGRRIAKPGATPATRPAVSPTRPDTPSLSAEADRFRASLAAERRGGGFDRFMREQRVQRMLATVIQVMLLLPGALCFMYNTPRPVSAAVELAGIVIGVWLKRERKRRIKEIASWQDEDPA